jgi:hypothetical protein
MRRTVDTLAVDPELNELQHQAATGMELILGQSTTPRGTSPAPDDPTRLALLRSVQEIRRTGRCDHPALQARITELHQVPDAMRGNAAAALEEALDSSQQLLGKLQAALQPIDAPSAPLQAILRRQLRRARRLDWRLRWQLLAHREEMILAPLALTLVLVLQAVVAAWRGETGDGSNAGAACLPLLA